MQKPIAWTIAGSDSGGGAGIQADLHTFQALGTYGCSVITAVTAQNTFSVTAIHNVPAENVAAQIAALAEDLKPKTIKLGMLGESAEPIVHFLKEYSGSVVLDPVLISTSAHNLFSDDINQRIGMILQMLPLVTLVTPNIPEAETILGLTINTHADIIKAAQKFLSLGVQSVIIKGGHIKQDLFAQDYFTDGKEAFWLACYRDLNGNYHGTGCTFASAITAALATDYNLYDALVIAKMYVTEGIYSAKKYGAGAEPVMHSAWSNEQQQLPFLSQKPLTETVKPFPDCGVNKLGLYPIVDAASWLTKLLPCGVTTIQLRVKNKTGTELENEIKAAIEIAKKYSARLFINDYWELAIAHGAYGVHLGQEDLRTADIPRIKNAGLRLGISTHNYYELAIAHALRPSYIALGPIYPTTSKVMPHAPQGIARLKHWRNMLNYPLVAIGGIGLPQFSEVSAAGVDGIAMISAITQAEEPIKTTQQMLDLIADQQRFFLLPQWDNEKYAINSNHNMESNP
ncbi:MAG TPA: thiamine phosphate synthase [Gammaproteobacteria bacterium]|nr:thiamine phosphate synthase [Gammaproteobacteria bacterium]